jgi:hypothetical protein
MPTTLSATESVVLRGGLAVPLAAVQLLWGLEERGFRLAIEGEALVVAPRSQLTRDDDQAIRAHRDELIELIKYCEAIQ